MIKWPAIYLHDIIKYSEAKSPTDFINRLHSGYQLWISNHVVILHLCLFDKFFITEFQCFLNFVY